MSDGFEDDEDEATRLMASPADEATAPTVPRRPAAMRPRMASIPPPAPPPIRSRAPSVPQYAPPPARPRAPSAPQYTAPQERSVMDMPALPSPVVAAPVAPPPLLAPSPPRAPSTAQPPRPASKPSGPTVIVQTPTWAIVYLIVAMLILALGVLLLDQQAAVVGHY